MSSSDNADAWTATSPPTSAWLLGALRGGTNGHSVGGVARQCASDRVHLPTVPNFKDRAGSFKPATNVRFRATAERAAATSLPAHEVSRLPPSILLCGRLSFHRRVGRWRIHRSSHLPQIDPHASDMLPVAFGSMRPRRHEGSRNLDLIGLNIGAGEGIRTLDPDLGKVVLYP
jgi:hypothetical protein